jgi:hypothetical protein
MAHTGRVSNPRYRPRDYAFDDLDFGREAGIRWRRVHDLDADEAEDQLAAAKLQHTIALTIRERLAKRHSSVAEHADRHHVRAVRWRALLNGDAVMRLEDIAFAQRTLGIEMSELDLD